MKRLVAQIAVLITALVMAVPASADDGLIAKQIIAKLKQHKQAQSLKGFDLGVQVDKGTVTMMGQVASSDQAMLALDVARRIPGVKLVVNDLYVSQAAKPAAATAPQPTPAIQVAVKPAPIQPVVAQQPVLPTPQYNATGAIGSAVAQQPVRRQAVPRRPVAYAPSTIRPVAQQQQVRPANYVVDGGMASAAPMSVDAGYGGSYGGAIGAEPAMPNYAWPSYASSPNYAAVSYPQQYSATAWPYIGPFYPYPQVPLGWRKVSLEWDDGWWFLDFTKK